MKKELMTPKQVQEYLGVSKMTLYRWRKAGILKGVRLPVGKNAPFRYDPEEIEELLNKGAGDELR